MNDVEQSVDAYLAQLRRRGASPHTPIKYRPFLARFAAWADDREFGSITAAQIELDYLAEWHDAFASEHGRSPSPDTQRNHIVALRGFFRWALRFDMIERDPMVKIECVRAKRKLKDHLTPAEFDALLQACGTIEDRFLVCWLGFTAMRISEANSVSFSRLDLSSNPGRITISDSKTDAGIRTIPVAAELRPILVTWIALKREQGLDGPTMPVFSTRLGTPVTQQQAFKSLKRLSAKAGITKRVSPHTLRRSLATLLLNNGTSMEVVSAILGHSNVKVTQEAYAELLTPTIEAAFMRVMG